MTTDGPGEREDGGDPDPDDPGAILADALAAIAGSEALEHVLALGWATVELDRAESTFRTSFVTTFAAAIDAPGDDLLGAHCRALLTGDPRVPVIVLLEPSTEGRLAATLARHGEGPAATWSSAPSDRALPARRSIAAPGPFGSEVLVLDGPMSGPHRLLVLGEPGTISS